jgi:hypothetical protein
MNMITENLGTIAVGIVVFAALGFAVFRTIKNIRGKNRCGGCGGCPRCG